MDQIRDILFGGLSREYDRRFQELGERLNQEIARSDRELERRLTAMDARLEAFSERLLALLRQESSARTTALDDVDQRLSQALRTHRGELSVAIEQVEQELARSDLRARESLSELHGEIKAAMQALRETQVGECAQLRGEKVSREDLADMMGELSMRLRGTLSLPDIE